MIKVYQKYVVFIIIMALGVGSIAEAAAGIISCLPKTCCCTPKTPEVTGHMEQMVMPSKCNPEKQAPCCKVEPHQPKTDAAVSSVPMVIPHRMTVSYIISDISGEVYQLTHLNVIHANRDVSPLKFLSVPIYLQTLSIIC